MVFFDGSISSFIYKEFDSFVASTLLKSEIRNLLFHAQNDTGRERERENKIEIEYETLIVKR